MDLFDKKNRKIVLSYFRVWQFFEMILFFYTFFFQYGVTSINGAMMCLCSINIMFAIGYIFKYKKGKIVCDLFNKVIVFVMLSVFTGVFITSGGMYGKDLGIRMIEYVLTAYSIYLLLISVPTCFNKILWSIWSSIALLAITTILKGSEVTSAGAIGIENLNVNEMSSYFLMLFFCSFILFVQTRRKLTKVIIFMVDILVFLVQIRTASRRGFIVMFMLISIALIGGIIPRYTKNSTKKKIMIYMGIGIFLSVLLLLLKDYLLESTLLGARLKGAFDSGDLARKKYQEFALQQFKEHPILGIGVGGIAYYMGAYSHSLYFEIFSCTGIILSVLLLVSIIKIGLDFLGIKRYSKNDKNGKDVLCLSWIGIAYWVSILVSGVSVVMIYDCYFYLSLAILAALSKVLKKYLKSKC